MKSTVGILAVTAVLCGLGSPVYADEKTIEETAAFLILGLEDNAAFVTKKPGEQWKQESKSPAKFSLQSEFRSPEGNFNKLYVTIEKLDSCHAKYTFSRGDLDQKSKYFNIDFSKIRSISRSIFDADLIKNKIEAEAGFCSGECENENFVLASYSLDVFRTRADAAMQYFRDNFCKTTPAF